MAKRLVFGRLKINLDGGDYVIEMKRDGIFLRRRFGRELVKVPFDHLVKLFARQLMLNYDLDKDDKIESLPGLWQGPLVPDTSYSPGGPLYESAEQQTETVPGRVNGVDSPAEPGPETLPTAETNATSTGNQLPGTN